MLVGLSHCHLELGFGLPAALSSHRVLAVASPKYPGYHWTVTVKRQARAEIHRPATLVLISARAGQRIAQDPERASMGTLGLQLAVWITTE